MNTVVEQRINLDIERRCLLPNPGMISLGGCDRHPQHEEDSVFMTPISSPAYSNDGTAYKAEIQYFASAEPSPTAMVHIDTHPLHSLPHSNSSSPFMPPGSPCEDQLCGSPYSPPGSYDNPSPHSLSCSSPPHGSPASLPCSDNGHFSTPYISPSPSVHDIPATCTMPMTSAMSMPYSVEDATLIYSTVPTTAAGYFPSVTHWMDGNAEYDTFQGEHRHQQIQHTPIDGEILQVSIIDQMQQAQGHLEAEMNPQISFYPAEGSPSASPEAHHAVFYQSDMSNIHSNMAANVVCPPHAQYQNPKSTKATHKPKKPKPVVQVNDEHIKDIPTSAQLWEFTLRVLKKPAYHYMINWENRKEGLFRFHDAPAFAALWGKHRNRPNMTYDKVARALRYYYKRDILNQVGGRLTYRFSKRLGKLYATDE